MTSHPPSRIVSLDPAITEILYYLGLEEQVTAIKEYLEDVPPVSDRQKPEYWFTMAVGRVISLKPDLVLTLSIAQQDLRKRLKEKNLNVLHLDPLSLRDVEDSFLQIGKATGTVEAARQLARDFTGGLTGLQEKVPGNAYRPKIYCEDWNKP